MVQDDSAQKDAPELGSICRLARLDLQRLGSYSAKSVNPFKKRCAVQFLSFRLLGCEQDDTLPLRIQHGSAWVFHSRLGSYHYACH